MLRNAARLFRSLNFPCAATASTCEDSSCFQVFGVNLFHVIANSSQRFVSRFEACMLIFTHSCVLSVVVVVSTIMVIIVLSFFITVVMISEMVSLNDVMSKCIFDLFLLPEVMGWEVGLIEVIAFIYFIGPCLIFLLHFCIMFSIQVSYRSIGVLIQGYAVDYSLHMVTLSAQLRKQCHHISMFGKWMLDIRLSFSPEPLNHCPSTITAWMFWFSFDIVVSTLSLLCEDTPAKRQSLH